MLGDSVGILWVRTSLTETLRPSARLDPAARVHHFVFDAAAELQDEGSVPRLLEMLRNEAYERTAIGALLRFRSPAVWRRLPSAVGSVGGWPLDALLRSVASDSLPVFDEPDFRDSVRALARRTMLGADARLKAAAAGVIVRYARADDIPALIGALTRDAESYEAAVLALVRVAGSGDEAMPRGKGTSAERARAQRWWTAWYAARRATFRPAPKEQADAAWYRMSEKLRQ